MQNSSLDFQQKLSFTYRSLSSTVGVLRIILVPSLFDQQYLTFSVEKISFLLAKLYCGPFPTYAAGTALLRVSCRHVVFLKPSGTVRFFEKGIYKEGLCDCRNYPFSFS